MILLLLVAMGNGRCPSDDEKYSGVANDNRQTR
jgi:hypothetical protein